MMGDGTSYPTLLYVRKGTNTFVAMLPYTLLENPAFYWDIRSLLYLLINIPPNNDHVT